jgi:hypothetical protein
MEPSSNRAGEDQLTLATFAVRLVAVRLVALRLVDLLVRAALLERPALAPGALVVRFGAGRAALPFTSAFSICSRSLTIRRRERITFRRAVLSWSGDPGVVQYTLRRPASRLSI